MTNSSGHRTSVLALRPGPPSTSCSAPLAGQGARETVGRTVSGLLGWDWLGPMSPSECNVCPTPVPPVFWKQTEVVLSWADCSISWTETSIFFTSEEHGFGGARSRTLWTECVWPQNPYMEALTPGDGTGRWGLGEVARFR